VVEHLGELAVVAGGLDLLSAGVGLRGWIHDALA